MSANYTLGPAWIFTSDNITDPLSSWTKLAMTRDGVTVRTSSGFLSMARADQNGLTPLAESVRRVGAQLDGAETRFLNNDIDEILRAIPGGVKITNTTKEAIGFGQVTATLSPKAFAVVPVDDYNEDTPGSWYNSDNVWYFENALMEITGDTSFALREGEDSLEGYTVDIKPFANATAGAYMGGRGLYKEFIASKTGIGADPHGLAVYNDGSKALITNRTDDTVSVVNLSTLKVEATISVGTFPFSVDITSDDSKAYVVNKDSNNVSVIDLSDFSTGTPISVGSGPRFVKIAPDDSKAYVSNYSANTITPITVSTDTAGTSFSLGTNPWGICFLSDSSMAYICSAGSDEVYPVTVSTDTVGSAISVGDGPRVVVITNDDAKLYVSNFTDNTVTPITQATNTPGTPITVGSGPLGLECDADSDFVYVCNSISNTISKISVASSTVVKTITLDTGDNPSFIEIRTYLGVVSLAGSDEALIIAGI